MADKFTVVKKGYDPAEVDRYIETLEAVIKSYKDKDTTIKNAIVSAQMAADNIVKNANVQADDVKRNVVDKLERVNDSLAVQKRLLQEFQSDYTSMIDKYVTTFNERDILTVMSKISELEEYLVGLQNVDDESPNEDE